MYSNLDEKEKTKNHVKFIGSDKTNSIQPLNDIANYKPRKYEWITEERNGIRYNRFSKIKTLPKYLPEPDLKSIETKNVKEKRKSISCDAPILTKFLILLILFLILSFAFSLFIWYQCNNKTDKTDNLCLSPRPVDTDLITRPVDIDLIHETSGHRLDTRDQWTQT